MTEVREYRYPRTFMRLWWTGAVVCGCLVAVGIGLGVFVMLGGGGAFIIFPMSFWQRVLIRAVQAFFLLLVSSMGVIWCVGLLWFRRILLTVYVVDEEGIFMIRGGEEVKVRFDEAVAVWKGWRELALQAGERAIGVSTKLEDSKDLLNQIKERMAGAGGGFPDEVFRKAFAKAARNSWDLKRMGCVAGILVVTMIALPIFGAMLADFVGVRDIMVASAALVSLLFALILAGLVEWLPRKRFRDACEEGWEDPSGWFAWEIVLKSVGITLAAYLVSAIAALYAFT